ncbi:hypothetical protein [Elioraea sp.]|uniref:hypothetical protein n=1 Tax=Elioraea sp. TaxID=2185103 RepID=UPI0025C32B0D|nr:hypothetical protein [Elioraea sp.]
MAQQGTPDEACVRRDLSARAGSFLAVWGAPVLIGLAAGTLAPSTAWTAGAWSLVLAWMGGACLVNARRCGRLHCYVSGPILLVGAGLTAASGGGVLDFGPTGVSLIVAATLALAVLTYLLELVWGRYRR